MKVLSILLFTFSGAFFSCGNAQKTNMNTTHTPMQCDPVSGVCSLPETDGMSGTPTTPKAIRIVYATDPICSACWAIEPQLRRLKLEYGHALQIDYVMGGLLPDWSYNRGGISKPSDVAHHWDEVSDYYQMPIDGDLWLEDPLDSSYPPSVAFKAAQLQGEAAAIRMLRILREMVFLEKKNIARKRYMTEAAERAGLNVEQWLKDYDTQARPLFDADMKQVRDLRVPGFPTLVMMNDKGESVYLTGVKPYAEYVSAIRQLYPAVQPQSYDKSARTLFSRFPTMTLREYAELSQQTMADAQKDLEHLHEAKMISPLRIKNGVLWKWK